MPEFKVGARVELVYTSDEYTRLREGSRGTLKGIHEMSVGGVSYDIEWDDGSNLSLLSYAGDKIKEVGS